MLGNRFWTRKYSYLAVMAIALMLGTIGHQHSAVTQENSAREEKEEKAPANNSRLATVKARGYLLCGVSGDLPGFSYIDKDGFYAGLDVDVCRAVAAAIFNDPMKVKFRPLNATERFDVLKAGEIDLLSRNTTQTFSRDTNGNIDFAPPTFYDAQGIMINKTSKIAKIADLKGKSICVAENTTSYDNLNDYLKAAKIDYQAIAKADDKALFAAYEHNDCQAITGDISYLNTRKVLLANPQNHVILPQTIAQEPLAPALLNQDSQWFDAVKWIVYALIQAEELDIGSENLSIYKNTKDSEIRRFLGIDSNLGSQMGLSDDFTARIIHHVGNYGEIYDRNIGQPFGLKRGRNALWQDGGLMYSPPFK